MNIPSYTGALNEAAVECALRRKRGHCRNSFDNYACNNCKYYIKQYIDADPRQVNLFMLQAENRADMLIQLTKGGLHHKLFAILIVLCLSFAWITWSNEKRMDEALKNRTVPETTVKINDVSQHKNIETTLDKVARDLRNKVDVNKDGLINCIDAAVLFYKHFPEKSLVCIEINKHPTNGFYHLFNCVLTDGVWIAIEPQAKWKGHNTYRMKNIWGNQYDKRYNLDVTEKWKVYAK